MSNSHQTLTQANGLSIEEVLHNLVAEQREELQSGKFRSIPIGSWKALRNEFKRSDDFTRVYSKAIRYHLVPQTNEIIEELRTDFVGKLFQDMAYMVLTGLQPQSRILLSPMRTRDFYAKLYPKAERTQHRFELDSLAGISAPDGILVEEHEGIERIISVYEFTLTGYDSYFENKYNGFNIDKKHFPKIFANADILFVVPKGYNLRNKAIKNGDIKIYEMPFTHKQFRNFINGVCNSFVKDGEGIYTRFTDFQEEARRQYQRALEHYNNGTLTPDMAKILGINVKPLHNL